MDKFCKYFGTESVVKVEGRAYPIEIYHTLQPQKDYLNSLVSTIIQVALCEEMRGDILAFLNGQEDIEETNQILKEKFQVLHMIEKVIILPLFANLP